MKKIAIFSAIHFANVHFTKNVLHALPADQEKILRISLNPLCAKIVSKRKVFVLLARKKVLSKRLYLNVERPNVSSTTTSSVSKNYPMSTTSKNPSNVSVVLYTIVVVVTSTVSPFNSISVSIAPKPCTVNVWSKNCSGESAKN